MIPQAFARQLFFANSSRARGKDAKTIAVQHFETTDFPAPPVVHLAPKTDRYGRHAKIQISEIGQSLTVNIAALDHHSPTTANFLRGRVDL